MSPSATIAAVVVALVFAAWLFQSDAKDPAYEAWLKRQREEQKTDITQKAPLGINLTDAGITKDSGAVGRRTAAQAGYAVPAGDPVQTVPGGSAPAATDVPLDPGVLALFPKAETATTTKPAPLPRPASFGDGIKLHGTFVAVNYVGDAPPPPSPDLASITFQRDGTFSTQNMTPPEVEIDPETGDVAAGSLDRGSGKYRLHANTLDLTYTDGLTRRKGADRAYTVYPVGGPDDAPTAITIQGKIFKLDPKR